MKEGSIILKKGDLNGSSIDRIFTTCVKFLTGSDYVHSSLYLGGKYWEFGLKVINSSITQGFYEYAVAGEVFEFIHNLSTDEINKGLKIIKKYNKYNFIKLFTMWFIYPLRKLWKKINWCPFSNLYFGHICFEAIDKVFSELGYDIIPEEKSWYTTGAEISKSKLFVKRHYV